MKQSNRGFVRVDLDACHSPSEAPSKGVGNSIVNPGDAFSNGGKLILDEARMNCLKNIIEKSGGTFDPAVLVSIPAVCETQ